MDPEVQSFIGELHAIGRRSQFNAKYASAEIALRRGMSLLFLDIFLHLLYFTVFLSIFFLHLPFSFSGPLFERLRRIRDGRRKNRSTEKEYATFASPFRLRGFDPTRNIATCDLTFCNFNFFNFVTIEQFSVNIFCIF